jgi:hypothetical protein
MTTTIDWNSSQKATALASEDGFVYFLYCQKVNTPNGKSAVYGVIAPVAE